MPNYRILNLEQKEVNYVSSGAFCYNCIEIKAVLQAMFYGF